MEAYQEPTSPSENEYRESPKLGQQKRRQAARLFNLKGNWLIGLLFSPVALLLVSFGNADTLNKLNPRFGRKLLNALIVYVFIGGIIMISASVLAQVALKQDTLDQTQGVLGWLKFLGLAYLVLYIFYLFFYAKHVTILERILAAKAANEQQVIRMGRTGRVLLGLILNSFLILAYGVVFIAITDSVVTRKTAELRQAGKLVVTTFDEVDMSPEAIDERNIKRNLSASGLVDAIRWYHNLNNTYPPGQQIIIGRRPYSMLCLSGWRDEECEFNTPECRCLYPTALPPDGDCTDANNEIHYSSVDFGRSFEVEFCLESVPPRRRWPSNFNFEPRTGVNLVTPDKLLN